MAKDKVKDKKERKEKKEKRSETDGVKKSSSSSNKEKKVKSDINDEVLEKELAVRTVKGKEEDKENVGEEKKLRDVPASALVPFAVPLAEGEKEVRKVLRGVKKSAKHKTLRRGVKEVVKYLRKSTPTSAPPSSDISNPIAIVIIAADISPMDVISHIPVLCEDHNVPYLFVKSRVELGEASATKRPTSVVLVGRERGGKKGASEKDGEGKEEWEEAWDGLRTIVVKASRSVRR